MTLTLAQWIAVDAIVATHSTNPDLTAAVEQAVQEARANTTATSGLSTEQTSDWGKM